MELELLRDQDINLFIERGMRGGISMISKRYAKASNPLVEGYDTSGFKWKRVMPMEEQLVKMKEHSKKG